MYVLAILTPRIDVPVYTARASVTAVVESRYSESALDESLDKVSVTAGVLADSVNEGDRASNRASRLPRLNEKVDVS